MKVKMNTYYQGTGVTGVLVRTGSVVNILSPDEVYEVDPVMGEWIVKNHKGVEVDKPKYYGAQPKPEPRYDEVLYETMAEEESVEKIPTVRKPRGKGGTK